MAATRLTAAVGGARPPVADASGIGTVALSSPSTSNGPSMARNSRLSRVVKEAVAEILRTEISDPRLTMVTITDADVTSDQSYATVW